MMCRRRRRRRCPLCRCKFAAASSLWLNKLMLTRHNTTQLYWMRVDGGGALFIQCVSCKSLGNYPQHRIRLGRAISSKFSSRTFFCTITVIRTQELIYEFSRLIWILMAQQKQQQQQTRRGITEYSVTFSGTHDGTHLLLFFAHTHRRDSVNG